MKNLSEKMTQEQSPELEGAGRETPDIGETNEPQETPGAQEAPETQAPQADEAPAEEPKSSKKEKKKKEKSETESLREQVADLNDRLLRTMAEYDNFRKRSQREKESIYPQATAAAVGQFVPIIDTFERALAAPCSDDSFKQGVEMILHNFRDVLGKLGVEEFGAPGEAFDPDLHNAVMHVEEEERGEGEIVEVFQKGYRLGDRIIRHAMVKVAN